MQKETLDYDNFGAKSVVVAIAIYFFLVLVAVKGSDYIEKEKIKNNQEILIQDSILKREELRKSIVAP